MSTAPVLVISLGRLPTKCPYVALSLPFTGTSEARPKMLTGPPSLPLHTQPLLPVSGRCSPAEGGQLLLGSASLLVLSFVASQLALVVKRTHLPMLEM